MVRDVAQAAASGRKILGFLQRLAFLVYPTNSLGFRGMLCKIWARFVQILQNYDHKCVFYCFIKELYVKGLTKVCKMFVFNTGDF